MIALLLLLPIAQSALFTCGNAVNGTNDVLYSCIANSIAATGLFMAKDQYQSCSYKVSTQNQTGTIICLCSDTEKIINCYNSNCPNDPGLAAQESLSARFCASATAALMAPTLNIIMESRTSYARPRNTDDGSYGGNVGDIPSPSQQNGAWRSEYITVLTVFLAFICAVLL